jgi:hypothetical protein
MFLRGEYFSYAEDFDLLESRREVQKLDPQQVIFHSMDWNRFTVDVRPTLSFLGQPSEKQIDRLDSRFSANSVDLSEPADSSTSHDGRSGVPSEELSEDEADLLAFIHDFIESEENDFDAVSASNCHRDGPARSDDARDYLDKLTEKGLLEEKKEVRKHNNTVVFRPK